MKFEKKFILILFTFITVGQSAWAQNGKLSGKVLDFDTKAPLSFASVRIFTSADSTVKDGGITDENGKFNFDLPFGQYFVNVEFMGYEAFNSPAIRLSDNNKTVDLGELSLKGTASNLDEVTVRAEKSSMELSLDKRVFNVGKDLANAGGSASEILVNIPSVTVDPDGAVKLRGSNNVRILIDGKPSGLVSFKGGAGLRQLQASMVERVEVITNPSARYEAEGMAGIINIILKKDKKQGFNGSFEGTLGWPTNIGLAANVNYRHKKLNFFVNYGLSYNLNLSRGTTYQETYDEDLTRILRQSTKGRVYGFNNNVRGGAEYYFSEKSILTLSYMLSRSDGNRHTENNYRDFINSESNPLANSLRIQEEDETEPLSETVLSYRRTFNRKNHELNAQFRYLDHWENSDQLFTQNGQLANGEEDPSNTFVQHSVNDEFEKQYLAQVDYVQPVGKDGKFEFGARGSFRDMENNYIVETIEGSSENSGAPELDNQFVYNEDISAVYGIFGNKMSKLSYQIGVRAEFTDVKTTLKKTNEVNPRKYNNLFPSVHFTYNLPNDHGVQLSYSRRIRRPVYNELSPFMTVSDSRNFFSGNPDLNPEYSDVYEIGHIKYYEKGSLSSSLYYRQTDHLISSIRDVNDLGFATTRPENLVGQDAYGIDITGSSQFTSWWKMDMNLNVFHANTDGSNVNESYVAKTNTWFVRNTSRFDLPNDYMIQFRVNFDAPQKGAQGMQKAICFLDLSARKTIWNGKGTLNLSVLDLLNSRWSRSVAESPTFYTYRRGQYRRRQINLTLNYRLKD
ncbi:TonB-dependent receptor [Marinilongibacter aquaticus]|uniref:TonB-dependent receptor domain-containing protein n=1 Tax=Marinilongibacter aquaticus TaxID=2975157 RepID=UPI0021BDB98B|nr:TonB-dependent receptor [Marinilongibacter aquaticus]UBM58140.1 TonB-dependent receptor [Marinilongibacter aquaticus]